MSNFTGNTHRAVIETSVPPSMELIASGPLEMCRTALASWLEKYPLPEFGTGRIVEVITDATPTAISYDEFIAKAIADPEGQRLATAAANLATTWGKEWAVSIRARPNDVGEASTDPADRDEMLTQIAEWNSRHDAGAYLVARVVGPWKEER